MPPRRLQGNKHRERETLSTQVQAPTHKMETRISKKYNTPQTHKNKQGLQVSSPRMTQSLGSTTFARVCPQRIAGIIWDCT